MIIKTPTYKEDLSHRYDIEFVVFLLLWSLSQDKDSCGRGSHNYENLHSYLVLVMITGNDILTDARNSW